MTARETSLDVARGAGIILVVYGHVLRGAVSADLVPTGAADTAFAWNDYVIYTFHMPLFFLLSGLHVCSSLRRAPDGFLWSKIRTIVYPYLLWSIAQGAVQIAMASHGTNHPFTLDDLLAIGWRPFAQFWFLYALMLCMLGIRAFAAAVPNTTRSPMPSRARGWLAGCAVLGLVLGAATQWGILSITLMNAPFFVTGVIASQALPGWLARNSGPTACAATATAFVAAVVFAHGFGGATSIWALPAAFSGIALTLQLAHRYASQPARAAWLAAIGCASMPIYLTHIFAMAAVRIVLMRAGITDLAVHLVLGTLAGVAIPIVVYLVALRTGFAHIAGFPAWPGRDTAVRTRTA
ncbi:acyltransferase [Burkholderia cenocepacia]|nr:acyltransferase [Burkholderia cenocepacia]RQU95755.1 acyltransferase [Burkholderia cenocepacia]RQV17896.1 acyltransferase [Burkholderia cenocepacia]RQV62800.1 acyltransferase [Burkholderia cenocepacia]RQV81565.1 acyltransferase [Burkholderia cenocepacia]